MCNCIYSIDNVLLLLVCIFCCKYVQKSALRRGRTAHFSRKKLCNLGDSFEIILTYLRLPAKSRRRLRVDFTPAERS